MRAILLAAAAGLVIGPAAVAVADTPNDALLQVNYGMWDWREKTSVLGLTVSDKKNLECMIKEEASITLSKLASDLDKSCRVSDVVPDAPGGYNFRLTCKGRYPGKADAKISHTDTSMSMNARGSVRWNGIPAGFSWSASANYVGECTADEYSRQLAKWEKKQERERGLAAR